VFGDVPVSGADEVKQNWDEVKRKEKKRKEKKRKEKKRKEKKRKADLTERTRDGRGPAHCCFREKTSVPVIRSWIGSEPAAVTGTNGGSLG
jgi:hypothetical protein